MSAEKQDGKISAIFTLGAFVENQLEKYRKELLGYEGTRQALFVLVQKFEEYFRVIDMELEKGEITLKESATAKRHVATMINLSRELAKTAEVQLHQVEGKIAASDKYVTDLKKMFDEEKVELDRLKTENLQEPEKTIEERFQGAVEKVQKNEDKVSSVINKSLEKEHRSKVRPKKR